MVGAHVIKYNHGAWILCSSLVSGPAKKQIPLLNSILYHYVFRSMKFCFQRLVLTQMEAYLTDLAVSNTQEREKCDRQTVIQRMFVKTNALSVHVYLCESILSQL